MEHIKDRNCLNCEHFVLWGTSTGNCDVHDDDFSCEYICDDFSEASEEHKQLNRL